jgi:hypothetical protein
VAGFCQLQNFFGKNDQRIESKLPFTLPRPDPIFLCRWPLSSLKTLHFSPLVIGKKSLKKFRILEQFSKSEIRFNEVFCQHYRGNSLNPIFQILLRHRGETSNCISDHDQFYKEGLSPQFLVPLNTNKIRSHNQTHLEDF